MFQIKLKQLREEQKMSQAKLAKLLNVAQSTVAMWENGKNKPEYNTLVKIANLFNIQIDYLTNNSSISEIKEKEKGIKIPVLGYVAAGIPIEAIEEIIDWEEIPESMSTRGEYFGLKIKGNSMEPHICGGDVVIIRKQSDIESGEIAIVIVNGEEGTCKKVHKHDNGISLISFNPIYPPKFYTNEEIISLPITILGKVVELRRKF